MLLAEILIDIAHLRDFGDIEARAVGIERRTPLALLGKDFAEPGERRRLLRLSARVLISNVGGRRAGLLEIIVIPGRRDCRARIGKPGAGILRIGRDDRRGQFERGLKLLARDRLLHVLAQLRKRACPEYA